MVLWRAVRYGNAQGGSMTHAPSVHPRLFPLLLAWLVLWAVIIVTWMYDANGHSFGMPGPVFLLMMLGPLLIGLLLGWGSGSLRQGMKAGMIGGVVYGLVNMAVQLIWGLVLRLLGRIPPDTMTEMGGLGFFVIEVVEFTVLFVATGLILGLVGGLLGAAVSRLAHR